MRKQSEVIRILYDYYYMSSSDCEEGTTDDFLIINEEENLKEIIDRDDEIVIGMDCICPKCRSNILSRGDNFCSKCGQRVFWG